QVEPGQYVAVGQLEDADVAPQHEASGRVARPQALAESVEEPVHMRVEGDGGRCGNAVIESRAGDTRGVDALGVDVQDRAQRSHTADGLPERGAQYPARAQAFPHRAGPSRKAWPILHVVHIVLPTP